MANGNIEVSPVYDDDVQLSNPGEMMFNLKRQTARSRRPMADVLLGLCWMMSPMLDSR